MGVLVLSGAEWAEGLFRELVLEVLKFVGRDGWVGLVVWGVDSRLVSSFW